jgi:uncharacterized surface protein with fasciclin (FAS1) repeats
VPPTSPPRGTGRQCGVRRLRAPHRSTLVAAVKQAGLVNTFHNAKNITVFIVDTVLMPK